MTGTKTSDENHGKLREGVDHAREAASDAYEAAREKATSAVRSSREKAQEAADSATGAIDSNPLGVIAGGFAFGALVAAILPRGRRERELLAPLGKRIGDSAAAAVAAAKEAGKSELDELGLNRAAAKDQVKSLLDGLAKAASSAGRAAAQVGKDQAKSG